MRIHWLLKDPKKKGRTSIYFTVRYHGKVVILYPRESIDTAFWINKNGINKPKPIADNIAMEDRLRDFETLIRKIYDELAKSIKGIVPVDVLKTAVYNAKFPNIVPEEKEPEPITVLEFFETFIVDSETGHRKSSNDTDIREHSIKTYRTTREHFSAFQKHSGKVFALAHIDQILINNFTRFLTATKVSDDKTLSLNATGKYMQVFKTMLRYAQQQKLISPTLMLEVNIKVRREKSDNTFLDENELQDMAKCDVSGVNEIVRDIFLIACYTGMRFGDLEKLTRQEFEQQFQKYIDHVQGKTSGKVTLPIHPQIRNIYEKYGNQLPKCPCNQIFNRQLKEIGQLMPTLTQKFTKRITRANVKGVDEGERWRFLSAHTARRSFCSNLYLKGIDTEVIMSLSGHTTEKSFRIYIAEAIRRKQAEFINKSFFDSENDENARIV